MVGFDGSNVYLHPETMNYLGDDTFWTWFQREFPKSSYDWQKAGVGDVVLQYSVLGPYRGKAKYIACCWEMYPEMQAKLPGWVGEWHYKVDQCLECSKETPWRTIPTKATLGYYEQHGPVSIIPLGVDTDVFTPLNAKNDLRKKYGLPEGRRIGFWSGTTHYMKGFDLLESWSKKNPDVFWIVCWKQQDNRGSFDGAYETCSILQPNMNELMNCADFFLSTGRLNPLFLVEWEALSSGLSLVNAPGIERELPEGSSRHVLFDLVWDRKTLMTSWPEYIQGVLAS